MLKERARDLALWGASMWGHMQGEIGIYVKLDQVPCKVIFEVEIGGVWLPVVHMYVYVQ